MRESRLLTAREVAEAIGTSPRTVYRLAEDGSIPFYRLRRQVRFRLAEVLDALRVAVER